MEKPSPADVLRFMAKEEKLARTLEAHPALTRADLASLLENAARLFAAREKAALEEARRRRAAAGGTEQTAGETGRAASGATARGAAAGGARQVRKVAGGAYEKLRVYSDGAARGNPGPAGAGAVLVAPDGAVVERLGRYLGRNTNNYAEYMGLLLGLERAKELGASEVEVYADSELMIRQLGGRYKVKAENLKPLFAEAMTLLRGFDRVRLVHVPREKNKEADEMSNRAIDERM